MTVQAGSWLKRMRGSTKHGRPLAEPGQMTALGSGSLALTSGRDYNSGYTDEAVEQLAEQCGGASLHDGTVWGQNAEQNRVVEVINSAERASLSMIGFGYRGEVLQVHEALERVAPQVAAAEQTALDAVDEHGDAHYEHEVVRRCSRDEGLPPPDEKPNRRYVALVALLVLGDLGYLATANQLFGLSDRRVLGIPFTDELHLSSAGSVLALVLLAHFAGSRVRGVLHSVARRRRAADEARRAELPAPDLVSLAVAGGAIAFAVVLLLGTSAVRADFLAARGVQAMSGAFLAIQLGILMAALALSITHAHPYGRALAAVERRARRSRDAMSEGVAAHAELVGHNNLLVDRADALLARAGHHSAIATADAARQAQLYMRRVQLGQPDPVVKRLFDKDAAKPTEYLDEQLAAFLTGISVLPTFERVTTDSVTARRELHREELASLRREARTRPRREPESGPDARRVRVASGREHLADADVEGELLVRGAPPLAKVAGNGGGA